MSQYTVKVVENPATIITDASQTTLRATEQVIKLDAGSAGPPGQQGPTGATGAIGPQGDQGPQGDPGDPGNGIVSIIRTSGTGAPGTTDTYTITYTDTTTTTFDVYNGADGTNGTNGTNGVDGKSVLNGAGAPSAGLGTDGDFYIDTTADAIYGPKTAGAWGSATSLIGPAGATGATGAGVVAGGTTGQVLAKASATDYDTQWITPSGGSGLTVNNVARFMGWADDTIEPRPRGNVTGLFGPVSGAMTWTQFTPAVNITVNSVAMMSSGTASSGLTLARMGVYSVNSNGISGTLLARTANDTTLFNIANTLYTRSFDTAGGYPASLTLTAGTRYAIAQLVVGTTAGNKLAYAALNSIFAASIAPVSSNSASGQTDLPATSNNVPVTVNAGWGRLS